MFSLPNSLRDAVLPKRRRLVGHILLERPRRREGRFRGRLVTAPRAMHCRKWSAQGLFQTLGVNFGGALLATCFSLLVRFPGTRCSLLSTCLKPMEVNQMKGGTPLRLTTTSVLYPDRGVGLP